MTEKKQVPEPQKKETQKEAQEQAMDRRGFLGWLVVGWASVLSVLGFLGAWVGRFVYPRAIYEQSPRFKIGRPEDYPRGKPTKVPGRPLWILHYDEGFAAMIGICTHLGCRVNWIESEGLFRCPCHGSVFDRYGTNIAGPAPRPLERAALTMAPDGRLQVDMSQVFKPRNAADTQDPERFFRPKGA